MKEEVMKLENFKPRLLREVEYFGVKISIPENHEWVATDDNGSVYSFPIEPEEQHGVWVVPQQYELETALIGSFEPIDENDAIKTLRHYPIEGGMTDEHQLGLAEAQLLGYAHHRDGYDLAALVDAMGLTPAEWQELQDKYAMYYLSDDDRSVIAQQLKQRE